MEDSDSELEPEFAPYVSDTEAPEMRPESGDPGKKGVKWHRLDYYEIAPLTGELKAGVLSRGGLMRRTAKRLRSDSTAVQLAAINRCAADYHYLAEGPCLRPLLEAVRELAGHGRAPSGPSTPSGSRSGTPTGPRLGTPTGVTTRGVVGVGYQP